MKKKTITEENIKAKAYDEIISILSEEESEWRLVAKIREKLPIYDLLLTWIDEGEEDESNI